MGPEGVSVVAISVVVGPEVVGVITVVVIGVVTVVLDKSSSQLRPLASLPLSQVSVGVQEANKGLVQTFDCWLNQKRLGQLPKVPTLLRQTKKEPHLCGCLRNE